MSSGQAVGSILQTNVSTGTCSFSVFDLLFNDILKKIEAFPLKLAGRVF